MERYDVGNGTKAKKSKNGNYVKWDDAQKLIEAIHQCRDKLFFYDIHTDCAKKDVVISELYDRIQGIIFENNI